MNTLKILEKEDQGLLEVVRVKYKNIITATVAKFKNFICADCYDQWSYDLYINAAHTLGKEEYDIDRYPILTIDDYAFEEPCNKDNIDAPLQLLYELFKETCPNKEQGILVVCLHEKDAKVFDDYLKANNKFGFYADKNIFGKKDNREGIYIEDWNLYYFLCKK